MGVHYACSRCHHRFTSEGEPEHCPNCGAGIGFEIEGKGVPLPMRLFGGVVAFGVGALLTGAIVGRLAG
jgi:hypothetical protein